jgi:hypothetical protein
MNFTTARNYSAAAPYTESHVDKQPEPNILEASCENVVTMTGEHEQAFTPNYNYAIITSLQRSPYACSMEHGVLLALYIGDALRDDTLPCDALLLCAHAR